MISNITPDDRRTVEESHYHVPAELVATDQWTTVISSHRTSDSGYVDSSQNTMLLESFEDAVAQAKEWANDVAFVMYDDDDDIDDDLSIIHIRDAFELDDDRPVLDDDIDLSPFERRDAWMGVSPDGRNLIIPIRQFRGVDDEYDHGQIQVHSAGKILFAPEYNDSLNLVDADESSTIARGDKWVRDWMADTEDALTDNGSPGWVKDYREWLKMQKSLEDRPTPKQNEREHYLANAIEEHLELMTLPTRDDSVSARPLYIYNESTGAYEAGGTAIIESMLRKWVGEMAVNRWHQVIDRIKAMDPTDPDTLNGAEYDDDLVCVQNGVVDIRNDELLDHDPKYKFTTSLPVEYDPDASGEAFVEFLSDITDSDADRKTLEEWVGFTLASDYPLDRFLMLLGEGGNGKGVYMDVLRNFIGEDNISEIKLERMTAGDRFGLSPIEGKMLNIDGDTTGDDFYGSDLGNLKKMTGGDRIAIEKKGQKRYFIRNKAKLLFSSNKPPRLVDESENAIARRLLWVQFPFNFVAEPSAPHQKQKVPRDEMMDTLLSDEAKQGILNVAIDGLQRLLDNECFSKEIGKSDEERYSEYMTLADDIAAFEQLMLEPATGHGIPKEVLYSVYVARQTRKSNKVLNKNTFFRALNKRGGGYWNEGQYSTAEGRPRALFGVRFTDRAGQYLSDTARDDVELLYRKSTKLDEGVTPRMMFLSQSQGTDGDEDDPGVDVIEMSQMQRIAKIIGKLDEEGQVSVGQIARELQLPPEQVEADLSGLAECGEVIRTVDDGQEVYVR